MPRYTFSMTFETSYYTTVESTDLESAEKIAIANYFSFENIEEGDGEWRDDIMLEDEDEDDE